MLCRCLNGRPTQDPSTPRFWICPLLSKDFVWANTTWWFVPPKTAQSSTSTIQRGPKVFWRGPLWTTHCKRLRAERIHLLRQPLHPVSLVLATSTFSFRVYLA